MKEIKFGTDGWRGVIADDFTFENVRSVAGAIASYVLKHEDPQRERDLYALATDVLIHLHQHAPMEGLRPHGLDQWIDELMLFIEWYCPAVGAAVDVESYRAAWTEALAPVAADGLGPGESHRAPERMVLR